MSFFQCWRAVWPVQMKLSIVCPRVLGVAGCFVLALGSLAGTGFSGVAKHELPNFDRRTASPGEITSPAASQLAGVARLKTSVADARVDWDEALGTPMWIGSTSGFLSGPGGGR